MQDRRNALAGIDILRKICNHPDLLQRAQWEGSDDYGNPKRSGKLTVALKVCLSSLQLLLRQLALEMTFAGRQVRHTPQPSKRGWPVPLANQASRLASADAFQFALLMLMLDGGVAPCRLAKQLQIQTSRRQSRVPHWRSACTVGRVSSQKSASSPG